MEAVIPFTPAQVAFPAILSSRPVDRSLLAQRRARVAVGVVLVTGAAALAIDAATGFSLAAGRVILGTWLTALAAVPVTLLVARVADRLRDPGRIGERLLSASLAWPIAGLALLLPLSIHALIPTSTEDFNKWTAISCAIVGHCHLALAFLGVRRVRRLVDGQSALPPVGIYAIVVALAFIPGVILLCLPPVIVAATGLPFLFLLHVPKRMIHEERVRLACS